jgi:hypothetical protein
MARSIAIACAPVFYYGTCVYETVTEFVEVVIEHTCGGIDFVKAVICRTCCGIELR